MSKKDRIDMYHTDFVSFKGVNKVFTQRQRGTNVLRNLLNPEKKTVTALEDVSFQIGRGEFVAYAGPNGAGKSTTMKMLCGMLLPTSGKISVMSMTPHIKRIQLMKRLGVLFGNRSELWQDHPVIQSFEWKKTVWDIPEKIYQENLEMLTELLDIGSLLKTFARELSLGQRMRADLAMMLLHSPEIILLDEPTLGLDVVAKRQMIEFLKKINNEKNVTIIVTSHDMDDLEEMAERILMIADGKTAYDGSFEGLRNITGSPARITVATNNGSTRELSQAKLISSQNGVCEYEADLSGSGIEVLLKELSEFKGISDIEIKKAPIEQVIAQLYRRWKN